MSYCKDPIDIEEEYSRNPDLKRDDIKLLRNWVASNPKYPPVSDLLLFLFLHSNYYDITGTQKTIEQYYGLRKKWTEIFCNRDPNGPLKKHLTSIVCTPLKAKTEENYKIFYAKFMEPDPSKFDIYEVLKIFAMITDHWLLKMGNMEGLLFILDFKGVTWGHVPRIGINPIRKLVTYVQDAFPVRLKGVHLINANAIVDKLLYIAWPFMKKELRSIIHVHCSFDSYYKFAPTTSLPKDYGGDDKTIDELHAEMKTILLDNAEFYENE